MSVLHERTALSTNLVRTVTGSLFDSLSGRDMPGAVVRIPELGRETTTDFLGRFRFDSVTVGVWDVVADYAPLAAHDIVRVQSVADIVEAQRVEIALAVPSLRSLWTNACQGRPVPEGAAGLSPVWCAMRAAPRCQARRLDSPGSCRRVIRRFSGGSARIRRVDTSRALALVPA